MLTSDQRLYLNTRIGAPERVLEPATVVEARGDLLIVRPDDDVPVFEMGQRIEICFETSRKFSMQVGKVESIEIGDEGRQVGIKELTEPELIEMRENFRVVAISEDFDVMVDRRPARLADVSVSGLSFVTAVNYDLEDVELSFTHDDTTYSGTATVRSIKRLSSGPCRYGVYCRDTETELRKGLQKLSSEMQRRQLKRRRAAA